MQYRQDSELTITIAGYHKKTQSHVQKNPENITAVLPLEA